jgi:hypothetical protein
MWPLNYIAKWANEWNVYGLKRIGDFNIYVTSGIRTWWPPMRIGNRPEIVILEFKWSKNISWQKEKNKYNSFLRYIF